MFQYAQEEITELEQDLKELDALRIELAEYFCEDESSFKMEECIKVFSSFFDRFKKAIEENKQRKIGEEKAEQRRKQREEQLSAKKRNSGMFIK